MKTTTKIFKTKVQNHIIKRLGYPWDDENDRENENATIKERLQNVIDNFNSYYNDYERRRTPNQQTAFIDFLLGLPECLSIEYIYYNIRQTLREWHEQTEAEAEKYTDDQAAAAYYWLIYREFCTLCKQNKIDF